MVVGAKNNSATLRHNYTAYLRKHMHFIIKVSEVNTVLCLLLTSNRRGYTNLIISVSLVHRLVVSEIAPPDIQS